MSRKSNQKKLNELKNQVEDIQKIIHFHEVMRNAYFIKPWKTPYGRGDSYAQKHTKSFRTEYGGHVYTYGSTCSATSNRVFFHDWFVVDDERKDVRAFKKAVAQINDEIKILKVKIEKKNRAAKNTTE